MKNLVCLSLLFLFLNQHLSIAARVSPNGANGHKTPNNPKTQNTLTPPRTPTPTLARSPPVTSVRTPPLARSPPPTSVRTPPSATTPPRKSPPSTTTPPPKTPHSTTTPPPKTPPSTPSKTPTSKPRRHGGNNYTGTFNFNLTIPTSPPVTVTSPPSTQSSTPPPPSQGGVDPNQPALEALKNTQNKGQEISTTIKETLQNDESLAKPLVDALQNCSNLYADALAHIGQAVSAMLTPPVPYEDIKGWLSGAVTNADACEQGILASNPAFKIGDANPNADFSKLCNDAISTIDAMKTNAPMKMQPMKMRSKH